MNDLNVLRQGLDFLVDSDPGEVRDIAMALATELEEIRTVARVLLALKDGPRDVAYLAAKGPAWDALRQAVPA